MATRISDRLPEGEPDPLVDAPEEETPAEPVVEPALDEAPAPVEVEEEGLSDEEKTYKKRYDDIRELQTRTAEERNAAKQQAEQALALARQVYEATQRAQATPPPPAPETRADPELERLRAEAEDLGITQEQLAYLEKLSDAKAAAAVGNFEQRYYGEQQQAAFVQAAQAAEREITNIREQFLLAHPDAEDKQEAILDFMRKVGVVEHNPQTGRDVVMIENFSVGDLEAAYEASQNETLGMILLANPHLYQSDEGMEYARRQMELDNQRAALATQLGVAPTPAENEREAALAAAETLPASHGPSPTSGGPPQDAFDEVLSYQQQKKRSVFSR